MDLAGIEPGDVLLEVDGRRLMLREFDDWKEVYEAIPEGPAGTSATFLVRRVNGGQTETIDVTRSALEYTPLRRIGSPVPTGTEYPPLSAQSSIESTGGSEVRRGWVIEVISVVPNATDMVLTASTREQSIYGTPTPPEEGKQYFIATIRGKYIGGGSDGLDTGDFDAAGDATNRIYEAGCGDRFTTTIPNALPGIVDRVEVLRGGVIEGAVCWEIDSRDAPTLKMRFDYQFYVIWGALLRGQGYRARVWYELSPMP